MQLNGGEATLQIQMQLQVQQRVQQKQQQHLAKHQEVVLLVQAACGYRSSRSPSASRI
jgi:hypothetical protein